MGPPGHWSPSHSLQTYLFKTIAELQLSIRDADSTLARLFELQGTLTGRPTMRIHLPYLRQRDAREPEVSAQPRGISMPSIAAPESTRVRLSHVNTLRQSPPNTGFSTFKNPPLAVDAASSFVLQWRVSYRPAAKCARRCPRRLSLYRSSAEFSMPRESLWRRFGSLTSRKRFLGLMSQSARPLAIRTTSKLSVACRLVKVNP